MSKPVESVLRERSNCGRIARADRFSILVDGQRYYKVLREALLMAEQRIAIVAWEFHSETDLLREDCDDGYPTEVGPLLDALLDEKPDLEVYILVWDYSLIYLQEREWKIFSEWRKNSHPRRHFLEDKTAPSGASHHQKIVSIDDRLAFAGGMDVSISRWDTTQHRPDDKKRVNPDGEQYEPFHDIQIALTG